MRNLVITVAMVIATAMVACGKKNDSVANPNPNVPGVNGYGYGSCVPGQYNCVNGYAQSPRVVGAMTGVAVDVFASLLSQYGGFCSTNGWNNWPGQLNYTYTFGTANCRSYAARGYLELRFDQTGTRAQIVVGAGTSYGGSPYQVRFSGQIFPVNNSAGMEIRGSGEQATGSWSAQYNNGLVLIIQQGAPSSIQMNAEIQYRGQHMADVVLYRY